MRRRSKNSKFNNLILVTQNEIITWWWNVDFSFSWQIFTSCLLTQPTNTMTPHRVCGGNEKLSMRDLMCVHGSSRREKEEMEYFEGRGSEFESKINYKCNRLETILFSSFVFLFTFLFQTWMTFFLFFDLLVLSRFFVTVIMWRVFKKLWALLDEIIFGDVAKVREEFEYKTKSQMQKHRN